MTMVVPVIRDISSEDWDLEPVSFRMPKRIGIHVEIGESSGAGADLYQLEIVNSLWLEENCEEMTWSWGRARLLMNEFDVNKIRTAIESKIAAYAPYGSWPEFASKLAPFLVWEFEGMSYPPFPTLN